MGMVKLMQDAENGETFNTYNVTMYGTADEITAGIANGTIDIANVPCNLASVFYNKTDGAISVAAINTLGVLYVVEDRRHDPVHRGPARQDDLLDRQGDDAGV